MKLKVTEIKGFNYQPSYSSCTFETWRNFDFNKISKELELGKEYFPHFNTVRIWLSWNAFCRGEELFLQNVEKVVAKAYSLGIYVMPVLFNRWHDPMVDCDGIYLDHFLPQASWLTKYEALFDGYIRKLMEKFGNDERILAWDLCNEPFPYQPNFSIKEYVQEQEYLWLKKMYDCCKRYGAQQEIGIGDSNNVVYREINEISDVFFTHMYFRAQDPFDQEKIDAFNAMVQYRAEEAKALGKEIVSNECGFSMQGENDAGRVQRLKVTIEALKKNGIGYTLYGLHNSDFADLHYPSQGRVDDELGCFCFINRDGSLRKGHDIFNKY